MIPRPLYKWKSFWLGILLLGFVGWAWVRSMSHLDSMRVGIDSNYWQMIATGGHLAVERIPLGSSLGWIHGFEFSSEEGEGFDQQWFQPAFERVDYDSMFAPGYTAWILAYWLFMLLFLVPWSGLLVWRWRRVKRHAAGSVEPPGVSSI